MNHFTRLDPQLVASPDLQPWCADCFAPLEGERAVGNVLSLAGRLTLRCPNSYRTVGADGDRHTRVTYDVTYLDPKGMN